MDREQGVDTVLFTPLFTVLFTLFFTLSMHLRAWTSVRFWDAESHARTSVSSK